MRLINREFVAITSDEEIASVEAATEDDRFANVSAHIQAAVSLLGNRHAPDYRNTIKESISAVEAAAKLLANDEKATLAQALKRLELHPALQNSLNTLYGYTNDAEGIRHSLMERPNLDADDAKFMLVVCSAFVNYLKAQM